MESLRSSSRAGFTYASLRGLMDGAELTSGAAPVAAYGQSGRENLRFEAPESSPSSAEPPAPRPPARAESLWAGLKRAVYAALVGFALSTSLLALPVRSEQFLVLIGGGHKPPEALAQFVEWSGGKKAKLLIVTWASEEDPQSYYEAIAPELQVSSPAALVHAAFPTTPEDRKKLLAQLDEATGVFFTGGDQNRIMNILDKDPELTALLRQRYAAGTPFGGNSAGTALMSLTMLTGEGQKNTLDASKVGKREGLGLLPGTIIDQHFIARERYFRLLALVLDKKTDVGLGIDESTAIMVKNNRFVKTAGESQVIVIDPKKRGNMETVLHPGQGFDLKRKKPLDRI